MIEIPADIMATARNVSLEVFDAYVEGGDADTLIAQAILAERERCAVIAHGFHKINPQAKFIADAIRKGE